MYVTHNEIILKVVNESFTLDIKIGILFLRV